MLYNIADVRVSHLQHLELDLFLSGEVAYIITVFSHIFELYYFFQAAPSAFLGPGLISWIWCTFKRYLRLNCPTKATKMQLKWSVRWSIRLYTPKFDGFECLPHCFGQVKRGLTSKTLGNWESLLESSFTHRQCTRQQLCIVDSGYQQLCIEDSGYIADKV